MLDKDSRHAIALKLLLLAFCLGVLGDILLREGPWGAGVAVFAVAVAGACYTAASIGGLQLSKSSKLLALAALFFAVAFAWRDATGLKVLNGCVAALLLGAATITARVGAVHHASLRALPFGAICQWPHMLSEGATLLAKDIQWKRVSERTPSHKLAGLGRGLLLATPIALLFGALLASADAAFQRILTPDIHVDAGELFAHIGTWTLVALLSAGLLRRLFVSEPPKAKALAATPKSEVGIMELATVLVVLNALFAVFVIVQFRYFFGGQNLIEITPGLSYAEYARKGFFELLAVVGLAIPLLLGAHALLRRDNGIEERLFTGLAGLMVVLLFVVAASALQRMRLYVDAYDLSPLRVYASAGMIYLIGVLGIFLGTTLRGRQERFAFASVVLLGAVVLGLNAINPDGLIARTNMRAKDSRGVDVEMLASLSSDATPALLEGIGGLDRTRQSELAHRLMRHYESERPWTNSNLAHGMGSRSVAAAMPELLRYRNLQLQTTP